MRALFQVLKGELLNYKTKVITPERKDSLMGKYYSSSLYERKASIHGTCIKFFTDNMDFIRMWEDNFEPMPDWIRPHGRLFALSGKKKQVLYEPSSKTAIITGHDYYGLVKSAALAIAADFMEDFTSEHRRYSIHGSFVDKGGHGLAIVGPSGSGKTTLTYGLLRSSKFNFLTDDWFFVRLTKNYVPVYSSERNSYIRDDLANTWPELTRKLLHVRLDKSRRAVVDVKSMFGSDRIKTSSNLKVVVLLARKKSLPPVQKLTAKQAVDFLLKNDFCNPHQLVRTKKKTEKRKKFFMELFEKVPVFLLNTVETPRESLARLKDITDEYL